MLKNALIIISLILASLPTLGWTDPTPLLADPDILALVNQVHQDSLLVTDTTLVSFYTRHTLSDTVSSTNGIGAARRWLQSRFLQMGLAGQFFPWPTSWGGNPTYPCYNVMAPLSGSGGSEPLIILGAHYDSWVNPDNPTSFAPGADDDGSGVAALLETARILRNEPIATTVQPTAFSGEEQGLWGSEHYVEYLVNTGTSVAAMINMDMIGHIVDPFGVVDSTTVRCFSGGPQESSSRQLARYVKWVGESYANGLTVLLQNALDRPGRGGDHKPFYEAGYPAVRLIETAEDENFQHNPNDLPVNMSFSYARKVTRLVTGVATVLAYASPTPTAPTVTNYGDGQSLQISWPDSICPVGGVVYLAYRTENQLYWEEILSLGSASPYLLTNLTEGLTYQISLSVAAEPGRPSRFSQEASGVPLVAPPPSNFETTSTIAGVSLTWSPAPEPTALEYLIERAPAGGTFQLVNAIPHPGTFWLDATVPAHQLYQYRITTRNTQYATGAPSPIQEGQLATHDLGILIVDATPDGAGLPGQPSDGEVDSFYEAILEPYQVAAQWDRADSLAANVTLSDADLAPYTVAFVYADYYTANLTSDTTAWRKYLDQNGKMLFTGWRMSATIGSHLQYSSSFGPGDFLWDLASIDSVQVSLLPSDALTGVLGQYGYPDLTFDAARFPNLPGGLILSDAFWTELFPMSVDVIGNYQAASGASSAFHDRPMALHRSVYLNWVLIDAPAFYMTLESATDYLRHALEELDAPVGIQTASPDQAPVAFSFQSSFPNPFNPSTVARYQIPDARQVSLRVYDTAGRLVATLADGWREAGSYTAIFDGSKLTSGVYLARLEAGGYTQTQKLVLLK